MTHPDGDEAFQRRRRGRRGRRRSGTSRIALFLGAGASAPYGMPTTAKLREKLGRDFPRQDLITAQQFSDAERILQALDDEIDFAKTQAGAHHCMINPEFDKRVKYSELARDNVEDLVRSSYVWNASMGSTAVEILGAFFELARSRSGDITVFTTNYDMAIEEYCGDEDQGTECIDGFELRRASREHVWRGNFAPSDESAHSRVILHKLHGSMSWQRRMVGSTREVVKKPDGSIPKDKADDVYIRPTLNIKDKEMREEPFATLLKRFNKLPESFDVCIVIGCSFRDKCIFGNFVELIKSGKTLIAVGPRAASEFWTALEKTPDPATENEWGKMQLCSMAYRQGEADRFFAVHKKLGEDSTESVINAIRPILEKSASPNRIGFIVEPNA